MEPFQLIHATNHPASRMLIGPCRNKDIHDLRLQQAHRRVDYYLAQDLLPKATGLEKYDIITEENKRSKAYRIRNEDKTVIVSCMRAGDPVAQGVFEALPSAVYIHAHEPEHLEKRKPKKAVMEAKTVLLCDVVVNNGTTMLEFIQCVWEKLNKTARIVMMAGVVHAKATRDDDSAGLTVGLEGYRDVSLVALRQSENKYQGQGKTDTGARLFNTTKVEATEKQ